MAVNTISGLSGLYGKTVVSFAAGAAHSLALCSDGTVFSWGSNSSGQLGGPGGLVPAAVDTRPEASALYGKKVVAIAAGASHSLALCSDGTVVAWGDGSKGQLGFGSFTAPPYTKSYPTAVNTNSGVSALYGKKVVAIAAGAAHSLALCSDGTVAAWGYNLNGQLGDGYAINRNVPVAVNAAAASSALYGKRVVAIAAGALYSVAQCADGEVVAWGDNSFGQLGDNTTTGRNVPVVANANLGSSALYTRSLAAVEAGSCHSVVQGSDGTVVAWGRNNYGQLGDNTTSQRNVSVMVNTNSDVSALYGKTVMAVAAGAYHNLAQCSDGTLATWGYNANGQLGDNTTTQRNAAVAVSSLALAAGECYAHAFSGPAANHSLALVATPPAPAFNLTGNGISILNGDTLPCLEDGTDFGTAPVGTGTVARIFTIQNIGTAPLALTGTPKVAVTGAHAADFAVTLEPASPLAPDGTAVFQVTLSPSALGMRTATLIITNDASSQSPYSFNIQGTGGGVLDASYTTANEVPLTTAGLMATGSTVNLTLNFAPAPGTDLMLVNNTSMDFINGTLDNLTNGQPVVLSYGGTNYAFVANYYGGSGNDLVLTCPYSRIYAWGRNQYGQLGDSTTETNSLLLRPLKTTGALAGKLVIAMAAGFSHSLALCSDGTLVAWGANSSGQLGDNTVVQRTVPVAVNTAPGISALSGKRVVAIAAGGGHSLALCSDGTVAAWGYNNYGQLGDNTATQRNVPVAVNTASGVSALYGKRVVAVAAGHSHNLALCSDGTVVAWGNNNFGQLGNGTYGGVPGKSVPTEVSRVPSLSALSGKTVIGIAAGLWHSLALCSDGTVAAWGFNGYGQLGDNSKLQRTLPVAVNTDSGVSALYGRTVVAIGVGSSDSLALCSDGTVAAWGYNASGQLGDNTLTNRSVPIAVNTDPGLSALSGKTVVELKHGSEHNLAVCSDGTVAAWGWNQEGQIGDNTTTNRLMPVVLNNSSLATAQRLNRVFAGSVAFHTLALVAGPPASDITLASATHLPDGSFQFGFTNTPGAFFGVLATTNAAAPASDWTPLADATEVSPGQFQFTDPAATNSPQRFYRVRSP